MSDTKSDELAWVNLDQSVPCEVCDHVATTRLRSDCCKLVHTVCDACVDTERAGVTQAVAEGLRVRCLYCKTRWYEFAMTVVPL